MTLTITEKQHWKERIEARINAEIKKLKATEPEAFKRIGEGAREAAMQKLGITEAYTAIHSLKGQISSLQSEHEKLENETARTLQSGYFYNASSIIETAINELVPVEEERLMNANPVGKRIIELGKEKESLLDTVWLATSSPQVRELWLQVDAMLGTGSTQLQSKLMRQKKPSWAAHGEASPPHEYGCSIQH